MRSSKICLAALVLFLPASALFACGSNSGNNFGDDGGSGADGTSSGSSSGGSGDGGNCLTCGDAHSDGYVPVVFEDGGFSAGDCDGGGCTSFPPPGAPACTGAPPINIAYPSDGTMVPPDMNVISVMWTPFGSAYKEFEVDFNNTATYMHVVTKCASQTVDTEQPPQPSGGCELQLDPTMWTFVANHNRGGDPVRITVRGTTDGMCATSSTNSVNLAFGQEDILGAIYYWKSTVTAAGTGGDVWVKSWGDSTPEKSITSGFGTCNGCHALSRDGLRMVINSDDSDSDDEYGDMNASLIDMTTLMPIGSGMTAPCGSNCPGFASFFPDHSKFLISNGYMGGYVSTDMVTNHVYEFDGTADTLINTVTASPPAIATMPDWSPDGKSVIFVAPQSLATWTDTYGDTPLNDDSHVFGGSLYTMSYSGGTFGQATPFLMSGGENNFYPSYSPDGSLVVFDRVALDNSAGGLTGCTGSGMQKVCPNDSFSNPNSRLMLVKNMPASAPIDLANANGSTTSSPLAWSNSWPKWSPFLQNYQGHQLLWIAFSSTRDYGLRVRNHVNGAGQFQCYPPDSYEQAGGAHGTQFSAQCQQPQIWMAAIDVTVASGPQIRHPDAMTDPSWHAFWVPFQDITTHNHTPQWTQRAGAPPPDAGTCAMQGMSCTQGSTCCSGLVCQATGTCGMIAQ